VEEDGRGGCGVSVGATRNRVQVPRGKVHVVFTVEATDNVGSEMELSYADFEVRDDQQRDREPMNLMELCCSWLTDRPRRRASFLPRVACSKPTYAHPTLRPPICLSRWSTRRRHHLMIRWMSVISHVLTTPQLHTGQCAGHHTPRDETRPLDATSRPVILVR
jgi:hypothetical protein